MIRNWQISLSERIDSTRAGPLYMQIIQAVIRDIQSGRLASGTYLPSSRELAKLLGVNRKTVVLAYEDLIAQGWLLSAGTRGTMVATNLPETSPPDTAAAHDNENNSIEIGYSLLAAPERPLALPSGTGLKIDEGAPDGRLFPPELLVRAFRTATHKASRSNQLQYRDPRGTDNLRTAIANMLRVQRGLAVTPENICITRGSQNGIFLASMALLRPGDAVIVEELTYEPAVAAFQALGAHVIPVGLDSDGMNIDDVTQACRKHKVRAIFVTPHHQFPTTVALRPDRRLRLIELSQQHGFAIIEDDYDHEFHFQSQPLLPIAAYAPEQVIYIGSLSKLLLPALRIGYIAAPVQTINTLAHMVSLSDGMGNSLTENTAALLIENGELRRHARKARQIYAERREAFARQLDDMLGDIADYDMPDGGLAFWLRFKHDLDRIESKARATGIRFASSRSFMSRASAPEGLRIGFASLDDSEAETAIAALAEAARQ